METNHFLYRGVNSDIAKRKEGLKPKGLQFKRLPRHGESYVRHGNGVTHGLSTNNSILAHQIDSSEFPSSGISTSPKFDIARNYATYGGKKGVVYKIDKRKLQENDIDIFIVKDYVLYPHKPEDEEVILRHRFDKEISFDIVVDIINIP